MRAENCCNCEGGVGVTVEMKRRSRGVKLQLGAETKGLGRDGA